MKSFKLTDSLLKPLNPRLNKKAPLHPLTFSPQRFPLFWFYHASVHIVLSVLTSLPEVTETKGGADGRDTNEPLSVGLS